MNPQQIQSKMSPDEAAASMAFATNLSDELLRQQNVQAAPEEGGVEAPAKEEPKEENLDQKIEEKVNKAVSEQMDGLKAELRDMLNE